MENEKLCAFCGTVGPHETVIKCKGEPAVDFAPSGDTVLMGQLHQGSDPVVTIHPDTSIDDIAALMSAFMDTIAQFPQVKDNPMAIVGAIQKGITGG